MHAARHALALLALVLAFAAAAAPAAVLQAEQLGLPKPSKASPLVSKLVASQWQFVVPEVVLQRAFLQQGSTARLKQVLLRLLSGQTVRVGCVGGSVTVANSDKEHGGYFGLLVGWLTKAFPKANIIARNGAVSGSTPMFAEHQLSTLLDPGVDLVLLEYAVNSRYRPETMDYEDVTSFERMLRDILTGQRARLGEEAKPAAAIIVNMWRCCYLSATAKRFSYIPYTTTIGDYYNILSQYYDVPVVQVRNGFYHAYRTGQAPLTDLFKDYPPNEHNTMTHPNAAGYRVLADLVIYGFYVALSQLEQHGITLGDLDMMGAPLPPPTITRTQSLVIRSWSAEALRDIVQPGSQWRPTVENSKFGFGTTTVGTDLVIKMSSLMPQDMLQRWTEDMGLSAAELRGMAVYVELGLLTSYAHMGVVEVSCTSGCQCAPTSLDTHNGADRWSVTHAYLVNVTQSEACELRLRCSPKTSSGEHKLSLRGAAVVAVVAAPAGVEVAALAVQPGDLNRAAGVGA